MIFHRNSLSLQFKNHFSNSNVSISMNSCLPRGRIPDHSHLLHPQQCGHFSTSSATFKNRVITLYFHHIYSKKKKRKIFNLEKQLNITGAYMFGKPGRIIAEGTEENVAVFLKDIKAMKWQRVLLVAEKDTNSDKRLFETFYGVENDRDLRKLMQERGMEDEFQQFFKQV